MIMFDIKALIEACSRLVETADKYRFGAVWLGVVSIALLGLLIVYRSYA
jgi:hypothetical protein